MLDKLDSATTYREWCDIAESLDRISGRIDWKFRDDCDSLYDYKLIASRLQGLRSARDRKDINSMIYTLRSGFIRNLGGIGDKKLFGYLYSGTKNLIEAYLEEIEIQLDIISKHSPSFNLLTDLAQSFGSTALSLHGGATFGLMHLGVVKALCYHGLLPKIIIGESIGSLIAALVCVHSEDELPLIFEAGGIDLKAFSTKTSKGNISRKIARFMKHGYLLDVKVLEDCVKSNLGDITFEEAYKKTKRILNITVHSSRKNLVPRVLNYLTAPNVLIRSAATASAASNVLFSSVDLLAKDNGGNIYKWFPAYFKDTANSSTDESPEARIAQLFNVNFLIISEATPYIVPFLSKQTSKTKFKDKIITFVSSELRYRADQLTKLNLLPNFLASLFDHHSSNITVAPKLSSDDFYTIFSNPTYASLSYWILKGERSVWPLLSLIKQNTRIEIKLLQLISRLSTTNSKNTNAANDDVKKRGNSVG